MSQQISKQADSGQGMRRELSTLSVMFIAVGAMVGSGVFMMTGYGVKRAGAAAILAYLIAAIISIISSLPQIIAVSACPCAGGYYNYISRFLSPTVAYFYQWQRLVGTLSIAPVAMAFGQYVQDRVSKCANAAVVACAAGRVLRHQPAERGQGGKIQQHFRFGDDRGPDQLYRLWGAPH